MKNLLLILAILTSYTSFAQILADPVYEFVTCPPITPSPVWDSNPNKVTLFCPYVTVGIGTAEPEAGLHIQSRESTSLLIESEGYNSPDLAFKSNTDQSDILFKRANGNLNGLLRFNTETGGPSMSFVNRYGGANIDLFKVTAQGKMYVQELIVQAAPFPDYVFEKEYDLMPLSEVKSFIECEGHLPKMPSANTVESEGMGVSDMLVRHTEKVEELTLYLIDLSESVKALQQENEVLKNKIAKYETSK